MGASLCPSASLCFGERKRVYLEVKKITSIIHVVPYFLSLPGKPSPINVYENNLQPFVLAFSTFRALSKYFTAVENKLRAWEELRVIFKASECVQMGFIRTGGFKIELLLSSLKALPMEGHPGVG